MASKKLDLGSKDLISSLPDALIGHILSFLSTKDAALTSVLSKRWRYLLAFVPNLDLDNSIFHHSCLGRRKWSQLCISFKIFVNRIMALQGNAWLNKVSIRYKFRSDPSHVNGWILNVLERGVLDLDMSISKNDDYFLPPKVFVTKTLVTLKLEGTFKKFIIDVEEVCLPKLKTLYLRDVAFDETGSAFAKLISGCPVLEELVMIDVRCHIGESFSVSKPTLKRLTVRGDYYGNHPKSVLFDTPNLLYLQYSDTIAVEYPFFFFFFLSHLILPLHERYPSHVNGWILNVLERGVFDLDVYISKVYFLPPKVLATKTLVKLKLEGLYHFIIHVTSFFMAMCNVKTLDLSANTLKVIAFYCKALPVFNKLIHLTINTTREVGWKTLPKLLKNCPNLETLVFDEQRVHGGNVEENGVCKPWEGTRVFLSSSKVKILKVMNCGDSWNNINNHTEMIKFFLETMPKLEQATIYYNTPSDKLRNITTELENLEKVASPICKIQVVSSTSRFEAWTYGLDLN